MKLFVLLITLYITQLSAFQSLEITEQSNKIDVLKEPAYFLGELTQKEAYDKFEAGDFILLPAESRSFGFSDKPLWIAVKVINSSDEKNFLSLINASLEKVELFTYQNDTLIATAKSGILIRKDEKDVDSFEPRFNLNVNNSPVTYLLKITSASPLITPLYIGSEANIMQIQLPEIILFAIFTGVFVSLFLHNLFLYFSTKERDYIFYTGYIFFIFMLIVYMREYLHSYLGLSSYSDVIFETISLEGMSLFLLLFTLKFFNIKELNPKFYKVSFLIGIQLCILLLITPFFGSTGQIINIVIVAIVNILSLYIALTGYFNNYNPANYYILALSGFLSSAFISVGMINGFLTYNFFSDSVILGGTAWEIIFFSLALGYKIKLLQTERNEALSKVKVQEKMLFLQSRQASVGELVGNIAHQWREPLAEIGSIQTNLKATMLFKGAVAKEKLLSSIEQSYNIIRHLSDTIDVFYRFFRHKGSDKEEFSLIEEIRNIQKMVHYSLEVENINLQCDCRENIFAFGDRSEFSNALLNIILNAKDILVDRKIQNPIISVKAYRSANSILITIEDNAGGIEQKPIEKIFEISTSSKDESIGIGLFIAKTIIEKRMRGKLSVKNSAKGAVFTINLPIILEAYDVENEPSIYDVEESALEKIFQLEKKVARSVELEKALAQWEDIFNQTNWGVAVHKGTSNNFEMLNPAFYAMYGYSEKELKNITMSELFSSQSLPLLAEKQKEAFMKGFVSFEAEHIRKDGSKFPVNIDITVIKDENGDVLYHIANIRDITEQKQANERLYLKKFAVDNINDAIFLADKNGNFAYVNEAACNSLGYTREELLSMSVGDVDPDWPKERWPEFWNILKDKKTALIEVVHKRHDGTLFPVEIKANYFEYEGVEYNLGLARDITERKAAQEELLLKEFALDKINEAVYLIDKDSMFHYVNDGACQALGYTKEELLTMGVVDIDPNFQLQSWQEHWEGVKKGGATFLSTQHKRKDGTILPVEIHSNYIEYNGVGYRLATARDITERLLFEAEKENRIIKMVAENSPDVIIRYDVEGRRTYVNPKGGELLGVEIGKSPLETTPIIDKELYVSELKKVINTGLEATFEITYINVVGGIDYSHIRMVPEFNDSGNISSVLMIGRDITELTNKTIELQKALEFNEGVIAAIPDLLFEITPDGIYVEIWGQNSELLVAQKELLLGKNFKEILPPDAVITSLQTFKEVDEKGLSLGKTYSLDFPDGKKWFELSVSKKKSSGNYIALSRDITERKELEFLLEKEHKFLTDAQRVANTGSWYLDIQNDVLTWSDETYRIFELDKENIDNLHKTFYECIHPDDRESVNAPYLESLKTGVPYQVEHRIVMNDGRIKHVIERCEHVYDNIGKALYSIGTVQDITERKIQEEKLNNLYELSPLGIALTDINGRYIEFNDAFCKICGYSLDELQELDYWSLTPVEYEKQEFEQLESLRRTGRYGPYEKVYRQKNGNLIPIQLNGVLVKGDNGEEYIWSIVEDISERKHMEQELANSYNFLHKLIDSIPDPVFVKDRQHTWVMLNKAFCDLIGEPKDALIGKSDYDFFPKKEADVFWDKDEVVFKSGEVNINEEKFTDSDGTTHHIQTVKIMFISENGDEYLVGTIRDITERKKMEDSVRALNETLEKRVEERTVELQELVATLHKEINEREKIEKQLKLVSSAVNSSNEAIYVNDKELSIIYVNEGACKMLGYTYEELTSMKIYEIDALYHVDDILALRDETVKSKQAIFESKHKTKDGNIIDVEIVGNPFVYDNMEVFVSVVKNISAKK